MRKSLYNPFMVNLDFASRMARGGGGGDMSGVDMSKVSESDKTESSTVTDGFGNDVTTDPSVDMGGGDGEVRLVDEPVISDTSADDTSSATSSGNETAAASGQGSSYTYSSPFNSGSSLLSETEKRLVVGHEWVDNGDGTLSTPGGLRYDHEAGESFDERYGLGDDYVAPNIEADPRTRNTGFISTVKDANGNEVADANGNTAWQVSYVDGTASFAGYGREGVMSAASTVRRNKEYNKAVTDDRTADDFETVDDYKNHLTNKALKVSRGLYDIRTDLEGNSTLYAPNGAVLSTGTVADVRSQWNKRTSAFTSALSGVYTIGTEDVNANSKRYIMESRGIGTDEEFNAFYKGEIQKRLDSLNSIYTSWDQAAAEQGITPFAEYYKPEFPDLTSFVPVIAPAEMDYEDWYKQNVEGILPEEEEEEVIVEGGVGGQQGGAPVVQQPGTPDYTAGYALPEFRTNITGLDGQTYSVFKQSPVATTTQTPGYQNVAGVYPTSGDSTTGTLQTPLTQTSELSAIPDTVTTYANYTGTTTPNLTSQSQQGYGGQVMYKNPQTGQILYVTVDANGNPMTYVPPNFFPADSIVTTQQASTSDVWGDPNSPGSTIAANTGAEGSGAAMGNFWSSVAGSGLFGAAEGGYIRNGYADGGQVDDPMLEAKYRIATMNGYNGPKTNAALNNFANSSEGMKRKFNAIGTMMSKGGLAMAKGGTVPRATTIENQPHRLAYINPQEEQLLRQRGGTGQPGPGGIPAFANAFDDATTADTEENTPGPWEIKQAQMDQSLISQTMQPMQGMVSYVQPQAADFIDSSAGQAYAVAPMAEAAKVEDVTQAGVAQVAPTTVMTPASVAAGVKTATQDIAAEQGTLGTQAQVSAQQQQGTSVSSLNAAQGQAIMMQNPVQREIQQGELISGAADAEKAAQFNEQIQAAQATPTKQATVQGQLEGLMQQFEGGETPAWAAGTMRQAMSTLAARGLGASSMAGQAVIQAAMESALPIAQMDAQTQAQFESQNLSNRQQRAMLAAQQRAQFLGQEFDQDFQARVQNSARIGDIANMNFTAEQQVALENSRAANTMELTNLSNRQAKVMAEAAALSNLDMANLNNRQQAAVQNAQSFLQMDMTNLSNKQQTNMFKAQQNIQSLFTDQAAQNAAAQFNASSENQTNQFFANLSSQTSQFNAAQTNAMNQFNVNSVNALREFNSEIQQQRDLFNAENGRIIAQANAKWRQEIATTNTAAQNESNMIFAKQMNDLTTVNLDSYWQKQRDIMSYAFQTANNDADRATAIFKQQLVNDKAMNTEKAQKSAGFAKAAAGIVDKILFG